MFFACFQMRFVLEWSTQQNSSESIQIERANWNKNIKIAKLKCSIQLENNSILNRNPINKVVNCYYWIYFSLAISFCY